MSSRSDEIHVPMEFDLDENGCWPTPSETPPTVREANTIVLADPPTTLATEYPLTPPVDGIPLQNYQGRWYILYTNFPMWLDSTGTKPNPTKWHPTFNYGLGDTCCDEGCCCCFDGSTKGFKDVVMFHPTPDSQEYDAIRGFDVPTDSTNTRFKWYGNFPFPLNYMVTSQWAFTHIKFYNPPNDQGIYNPHPDDWALVEFSKTCCTDAGYDIICRTQNPSKNIQDEMTKVIDELSPPRPIVSLYPASNATATGTNCAGTCFQRKDPLTPPCCLCSCGRTNPFDKFNRQDPNKPTSKEEP